MKIAKTCNIALSNQENYIKAADTDLKNIFLALQGRIRFGTVGDGDRGENISGEWQVFTTNATPDTEDTIAHTIGAIPQGYIVVSQSLAGSLYLGTTAWTATNVYFRCSVASVAVKVFLLK